MGVYVDPVLAYGGIGLLSRGVSADVIRHSLIGLVTASALLHSYYDRFIWKVRETQTRAMLGIDGRSSSQTVPCNAALDRTRLTLGGTGDAGWFRL